jgi:hypothetical protein
MDYVCPVHKIAQLVLINRSVPHVNLLLNLIAKHSNASVHKPYLRCTKTLAINFVQVVSSQSETIFV